MPTYLCLDFLFCTHFETKATFPNLCKLTLLPKRVTVWVNWDMSRIRDTTSIDRKGKGQFCWLLWSLPWLNTNIPTLALHSHLFSFIFLKVQKTNLPHLAEMLEQTCSSFWVCQDGKTDYQLVKALWKLNSSISIQNYPYNCQTNIRHTVLSSMNEMFL